MACGTSHGTTYQDEGERPPATFSMLTDEPEATRPLRQIAEAFHKLHPQSDLQISLLAGESSFYSLLSTKFAVGDSPDLMLSQTSSSISLYARGGYLMDLTDAPFLKRAALRHKLLTLVDNRVYALPVEIDVAGLIVNLDVLHRYGMESIPATFPEFIESCRTLTANGLAYPIVLAGSDGITLMRFIRQYLIENVYSHDPRFYSELLRGRGSWTGPAVRNAFSAFALIKTYANSDVLQLGSGEALRRFAHGEAAFIIDSSGAIPVLRQTEPNLSFELVPPPWGDTAGDARALVGVGSAVYASAMTQQQQDVLTFLDLFSEGPISAAYDRAVGGAAPDGNGTLLLDPAIKYSGSLSGRLGGEWSPTDEWLPGFDLSFGRLVQDWYAGRSTNSVLAALEQAHERAMKSNPDYSRQLLAQREISIR